MIKFWLVAGFILFSSLMSLVISAQDHYEYKDFIDNGKLVKAFPMEQEKNSSTKERERDAYISYTTLQGETIYGSIHLPNFMLTRLHENGFIYILYLPNQPKMIIYNGDDHKKKNAVDFLKDGIIYSVIFIVLFIFRQRVARLLRFIRIPIPISY